MKVKFAVTPGSDTSRLISNPLFKHPELIVTPSDTKRQMQRKTTYRQCYYGCQQLEVKDHGTYLDKTRMVSKGVSLSTYSM